jgi:hypothetical protein
MFNFLSIGDGRGFSTRVALSYKDEAPAFAKRLLAAGVFFRLTAYFVFINLKSMSYVWV